MRLTCPACDAAYEVPAALLTPARRLRCAQCGAEWLPQQKADQAASVAAPQPAPEPPAPQKSAEPPAKKSADAPAPRPLRPVPPPAPAAEPEPAAATVGELRQRLAAAQEPDPPKRTRSAALLAAAWAATVLLLIAGGWGAYIYRGKVMQAWPPSQRAYAAIGLAPP